MRNEADELTSRFIGEKVDKVDNQTAMHRLPRSSGQREHQTRDRPLAGFHPLAFTITVSEVLVPYRAMYRERIVRYFVRKMGFCRWLQMFCLARTSVIQHHSAVGASHAIAMRYET